MSLSDSFECCWVAAAAAAGLLLLLLIPIAMPILGHHRNPRLGVIGAHVQQRREREREREREGGEVKIFLAEILFYFLPLLFCFLASFCSSSRTGRQNGRGRKCNLVIFPLDYVEAH